MWKRNSALPTTSSGLGGGSSSSSSGAGRAGGFAAADASLPAYSIASAPSAPSAPDIPFSAASSVAFSDLTPPSVESATLRSKVKIQVSCTDLANRDVWSKSDPQVFVYHQHVNEHTRMRLRRNNSILSTMSGDSGVELRMTGTNGVPEVAGGWKLAARSKPINDTLNPIFPDIFSFDYYFEEIQNLCFVVVDVDNNTGKMVDQEYLGHLVVSLAQVVAAGSRGYTTKLTTDCQLPRGIPSFKNITQESRAAAAASNPRITLLASSEDDMRKQVVLKVSCRGLERKDLNGLSDPYFVVSRIVAGGLGGVRNGATRSQLLHIFKSPVIRYNLNPRWNELRIPYSQFSPSGSNNEPLRISVWDWDETGGDDYIGSFDTTPGLLLSAGHSTMSRGGGAGANAFPLINAAKTRGLRSMFYKNSGTFVVEACSVVEEPQFIDFIAAGAQISLSVAIDLTASNQSPHHPTSLHHFRELARGLSSPYYPQPHEVPMNPYQSAIVGVAQVLQEYDTDKIFPLYGFGFEKPRRVRHKCGFFGNVTGVDGLLAQYRSIIMDPELSLSGPTDFAPVIRQACQDLQAEIASNPHQLNYGILLIITDGLITDLDATLAALVQAAKLPLSIVVVGVGNEDFGMMKVLDGDDGDDAAGWRTLPGGQKKVRDIVQFVAMREVEGDPFALARETLAEIPDQFMEYVREKGIRIER
ncbi:Copine-domain-containing protein [Zopfochytrium polystomum]|nr:Copine-domain-containing protein [Zopfochytrium polystomum]